MPPREVIILDYSDYQLLKQGPSTHGLFTAEGAAWAKLKQDEPFRNYSLPLQGRFSQKLIDILTSFI